MTVYNSSMIRYLIYKKISNDKSTVTVIYYSVLSHKESKYISLLTIYAKLLKYIFELHKYIIGVPLLCKCLLLDVKIKK